MKKNIDEDGKQINLCLLLKRKPHTVIILLNTPTASKQHGFQTSYKRGKVFVKNMTEVVARSEVKCVREDMM